MFLALNFIPLLTKYGNSNAETADVSVEIGPVLSLTLTEDEITLNPTPTPEGTFIHDTLSAIVDTNNKTGYTLTMNTEEEETALAQEDGETKIDSLVNEVTVTSENQSNFTMNHWGYALTGTIATQGTTFNKIPALSTPDTIAESEGPISGDTTPVSFATRVDTSLPSGTYKNTLVFTATANYVPEPAKNFFDITTMQEMTAETCNTVATPSKDAITIVTSKTEYTDPNTQVPSIDLKDTRDNNTYTVRKLADGNCWMTQNLKLLAPTTLTPEDSDVKVNYDLVNFDGYIDRFGEEVLVGQDTYGTAFSWTAAIAGSAKGEDAPNSAESSVCPKGWQLPSLYGTKSFKALMDVYSIQYNKNPSIENTSKLAALTPLGYEEINDTRNTYWTNTPRSDSYAYGFYVGGEYGYIYIPPDQPDSTMHGGGYVRCVARSNPYAIKFNKNGGTGNIPSVSTLQPSDAVDLNAYSKMITNSDYTLIGWKNQDGETFSPYNTDAIVNRKNRPTVELTAQWQDLGIPFKEAYQNAGKSKVNGYYTMQDMTSGICDAVPTPAKDVMFAPKIKLIDTRDNSTYEVSKLADGNCWMSQNLRLKLTANQALTSADTDVASNFTPTISTQATSENTTSWGAINNATDVNTSRSYDTGNEDYGVYYNWYTATAGTGNYSMTSGNATGSICPKGWQLPLKDGTKSYYNLITTTYGLASSAEGSTALQSAPLSFPLSSRYNYSGSVSGQGYAGYFWSATPDSSAKYAVYLYLSSYYFGLQGTDNKAYGLTVRCVSR